MNKREQRPMGKPRARDLGIEFDGEPGGYNAITDVAGVEVGYATLIRGDGALVRGRGPVRTGVTGILPRGRAHATAPVVATDAPLLPHQLKRLARRVSLGVARTGSVSHNGSGDLFLALSTANAAMLDRNPPCGEAVFLSNDSLNPLFTAVVESTEEAIIDSMVANETMIGRDGLTVMALPHDRLMELCRRL